MMRTRKQWQEIVPYRLDDVREGVIRNYRPSTVIRSLRSFELISEHYDLTCLAVDVWCLFDRRLHLQRQFATTAVIRDPLIRIFFGIVVQSLHDVRVGRPCDVYSWIVDHPPGVDGRCTPTTHICKDSALDFIIEIGSLWEAVLHLPAGMLTELATKENGSAGSRSQAILNCADQ
ncbi:hypothetical protein KA005_38125 [bacterium]|nr:hypothetical protein [bacterium]